MVTRRHEANLAARRSRWGALVKALGLLAVVGVLAWRNPIEQRWIPPCPVGGSGFLCPGCGSFRAIHHLSRLHVQEALKANLLMVVIGVPAILWFLREQIRTIAERRVGSSPPALLAWIILGIILVFTLARNLPGPALDALRPTPLSDRPAGPVSSGPTDQTH